MRERPFPSCGDINNRIHEHSSNTRQFRIQKTLFPDFRLVENHLCYIFTLIIWYSQPHVDCPCLTSDGGELCGEFLTRGDLLQDDHTKSLLIRGHQEIPAHPLFFCVSQRVDHHVTIVTWFTQPHMDWSLLTSGDGQVGALTEHR